MFDVIPNLLSSVASFLFPLFASYKALKTSDPAQLTPWLMYWVVLACALLVESWTVWFLAWVPFYAYIRLLFLLYLVLPQTQGARLIYEEYVHPYLEKNETAIEEFIASAAARLRSAGIAYLKRAIELLKTNVLGLPPTPEAAAAPEPQTPQSYTQSLLARFTLPSARWNYTAQGGAPTTAATPAAASAGGAGGSIIPDAIRSAGAAARTSFIQAQRERLRFVLSALDREEEEEEGGADPAQKSHPRGQSPSQTPLGVAAGAGNRGSVAGAAGGDKRRSSLGGASVASGLSKSRSEGDFEKLDAPSGGEEMDLDDGPGGGVRRRAGQEAAAGGWMPWGWGGGGGGGGEAGRSSGVEK